MKKKTLLNITILLVATAFIAVSCSEAKTVKEKKEVEISFNYEDFGEKAWIVDIEELTNANKKFRATWWTGKHLQMTVMSLKPGEEIGLEAHPNNDQFLRLEQGTAKVYMGKTKDKLTIEKKVFDDWAIFIPAGYWHNLVNVGNEDVKLYSIYSPIEHPAGTVHALPEDDEHEH